MQQGLRGVPDRIQGQRCGHAGDPIDDQRALFRRGVADTPRAVHFGHCGLEPFRSVGVEREQRFTGGDGLAGAPMDAQPRAGLHPLTWDGAARAEPPHRQSHRHRVDESHRAIARRRDGLGIRTDRQRSRQVAALRGDQLTEPVHRRAVLQCLGGVDPVEPGGVEHLGGQRQRQLHHIGGPSAGQYLQRFLDLDGVANGAAQRCLHVRQQRARHQPLLGAQLHHRAGQFAGLRLGRQERPAADLAVEHQRPGALGDLLAHHGAGDQRQRFGGGGDIAQRIDLPVGRGQLACREDRRPEVAKLLPDLGFGDLGGETRDGLQLVEGSAGVPEAAPRGLWHRSPARHHDGNQRNGDLVADAAGGMLVHQRQWLAVAPQIRKVQPLTGVHHGRRPAGDFGAGHAPQEDGHQQRRHLLVGDPTVGIAVDHPVDRRIRQHPAVALGPDDGRGVECEVGHGVSSCAGSFRRARSCGPNASGSSSLAAGDPADGRSADPGRRAPSTPADSVRTASTPRPSRPHTTVRSACLHRRNAGRRPQRTRHRDQGHMRHSPHCSRPPCGDRRPARPPRPRIPNTAHRRGPLPQLPCAATSSSRYRTSCQPQPESILNAFRSQALAFGSRNR